MRRSRVLLGSLASAAAAVALVAASMAPANAASGPYVVKAGSQTTGTTTFTAATIGASPQIKFTTSRGLQLGCDSGTASGSVKLGNSAKGVGIGSITATQFTGCVGPANLPLTVTQNGTWGINATGPVAANGSVKGRIVNVNAFVSAANPQQCSFTVTGSVNGAVIQAPTTNQRLKVGPPAQSALTISNVTGCFGTVINGDTATFAATYKLRLAAGPLSITNG